VIDTLELADWPTETEPKVTEPGEAWSVPELAVAFAPWLTFLVQPVMQTAKQITASQKAKIA
jgi:hypothetical protein